MAGIALQPGVLGAGIQVQDSTALAAYPINGITLGTVIYNVAVGALFILQLSSAALVDDNVVAVNGVSGARWVYFQNGQPTPKSTTIAVAAADMTVSGLTGDTDGGYVIVGNIQTIGTISGALNLTLRTNGGVPNLAWSGGVAAFSTSAPANIGPAANLYISSPGIVDTVYNITFRAEIGSAQGMYQQFNCTSLGQRVSSPAAAAAIQYVTSGQFFPSAQITSVSVHADVAGAIDVGSYMYVQKRGII